MLTQARKSLSSGERIRVLVVDDSVVIRRLVTHVLSEDPQIEVIGTASNGSIALARIDQLTPDVITLDIEMPEMNGLEMLRRLKHHPARPRTIMFSTLTERGASATLEALALGADDYVAKAANAGSLDQSLASLREEMLPKLKQFFSFGQFHSQEEKTAPPPPPVPERHASPGRLIHHPEAVLIGVSTGGPAALSDIIPQFPAQFPLPILLVQHMPPMFTRMLAERLQSQTRLHVCEAEEGMTVRPAHLYVAPGDYHMVVQRNGVLTSIHLEKTPPENSCRPAVDVLFRSAAQVYGGAVVASILTGMGQDGLKGVQILRAAGAYILAQDESTSVVWGMPGAVARANLADRVLPLREIVPEIVKRSQEGAAA